MTKVIEIKMKITTTEATCTAEQPLAILIEVELLKNVIIKRKEDKEIDFAEQSSGSKACECCSKHFKMCCKKIYFFASKALLFKIKWLFKKGLTILGNLMHQTCNDSF